MTCSDVQERAAGLAALAEDDAERAAAYRHADGCAACARALHEGEQVLALLDAAPPPPAPSAAALRRAADTIRAELRAERVRVRVFRLLVGFVVAASVALAVLAAAEGGLEIGEGIECLGVELGSAALAVIAAGGIGVLAARRAKRAGGEGAGWMFSNVAGAGAFVGQVVLLWRCPAHGPSHLFVFHVGGVVLAVLLVNALARRYWSGLVSS